jgi:ABC-type Fe3+/spermidine/putrescine transport system ATPase subunit
MGSRLDISRLSKSFQGKTVLNDLSLSIADGEFVSLLGPSGCGKTTTLNLVAGFFAPDRGTIELDGRDITPLPTHERGVSMVFQNYALFPHMTIEQNIGFGLKMAGKPAGLIAQRVEEMLQLVQLPGVGKRFPRQLSGGQQQRIGLARALAVHPGLLVLDEPMSNLDAKLRRQMQLELREILQRVGTTTLYVTHDQEEALAMSDRVVVMNEGQIEQIGSPTTIYYAPETHFVAGFVGESNFLDGDVTAVAQDRATVQVGSGHPVSVVLRGGIRPQVGDAMTLLLRPEHIRIAPRGAPGHPATITALAFGGSNLRLRVKLDGLPPMSCEETSNWAGDLKVGSVVNMVIDEDAWVLMPRPARAAS